MDGKSSLVDLQTIYTAYAEQPNDANKSSLWVEVYRFYHSRLRDEDLASDSTTQAIEGIETYNPALGPLNKWLTNVAANLRKDHQRKNRDVQVEEYELEDLENLAAPTGIKLDLAVLQDPQTRMLCEDIVAGYSIGEAAERCGLTPAAAYKRLARLSKNISRESLIR